LFVDASGNVTIPQRFILGPPNNVGGLSETTLAAAGVFNTSRLLDGSTNPYLQTGAEAGIVYFNADGTSVPATAFRVGNTERMRLDSSGRLGLGTSSPTAKFESYFSSTNPSLSSNTGAGLSVYGTSTVRLNFGNYPASPYSSWVQSSDGIGNAWPIALNPLGGNVGIGTTGPQYPLHTETTGTGTAAGDNTAILVQSQASGRDCNIRFGDSINSTARIGYLSNNLYFYVNGNERGRWDSSGRFLVGTSTSEATRTSALQVVGSGFAGTQMIYRTDNNNNGATLYLGKNRSTALNTKTVVQANDAIGDIIWIAADGAADIQAARISAEVDGTPGANDMPGRLVFSTTADGASSPTERMRITNAGRIGINQTNPEAALVVGDNPTSNLNGFSSDGGVQITSRDNTGGRTHYSFRNPNGEVGFISTSGTATAYNTSSDYRLKDNVVPLTGAIERINELQVHRFNFIADPDKTVDGFIAHEAQAVVPECVTGTKDEVDADGSPVYQGIDQSKLVPLLTAALQEALAEIASLKDRVAALEAS
jgi:hypothetical protein